MLSGVKFSFNPDLPPLSRIKTEDIFVNGERLQLDKTYKAAIKGFLIEGKDGYEAFKDGFENIILDKSIHDIITNFFESFRKDFDGKKDKKREIRMNLFNTNENNTCENGFIKITPPSDQRIINLKGNPENHFS